MAKESSLKEEAKAEHESVSEERREHDKRARGGGTHSTHSGFRQASGGMEMDNEGPMPGHPMDKKGGRARRKSGGGTDGETDHPKVNEYNAEGSPAMGAAKDQTPGFSKGGHKKRRDGGMAEGETEKPRLDRRPRRAAGGGVHSPYSSASAFSPPSTEKSGKGYEGEKVPG